MGSAGDTGKQREYLWVSIKPFEEELFRWLSVSFNMILLDEASRDK